MTDTTEALGRRAVACPHWRWMPGMLDDYGDRVIVVDDRGVRTTDDVDPDYRGDMAGFSPDLTDPATLGCFIALYQETRGAHDVDVVSYAAQKYRWGSPKFIVTILAALEAAPPQGESDG